MVPHLQVPTEQRFQRVARLAARVFGLSGAQVLLAGTREEWRHGKHRVSLDAAPRSDPLAAQVVATGHAIVIAQEGGRPPLDGEPAFFVGYPLHAPNGAPVGVLCVRDESPRRVRPEDLALLRDLASILEDEFRRMELSTTRRGLLEELGDARRRALIDPLTHVWNRAGLSELLQREIPRSASLARPLSIAMIDLDAFKQVNDTHGHVVGDLVLEAVAERLRVTGRPGDSVARYGGEEFAVLLPGCGEHDAPLVGDRLRQRVAAEPFRPRTGVSLPLTVSIGVATLQPGESAQQLVQRADEALYAAKRAGRNRVLAAPIMRA